MNETNRKVQDIFSELHTLVISDKIRFLEDLLFYFTITGRSIWSDALSTDTETIEAFKWLNELIHRIWNIRFELKQGDDNDFVNKLHENMKFCGEQSNLFRTHLAPTILGAFKKFKAGQQ